MYLYHFGRIQGGGADIRCWCQGGFGLVFGVFRLEYAGVYGGQFGVFTIVCQVQSTLLPLAWSGIHYDFLS